MEHFERGLFSLFTSNSKIPHPIHNFTGVILGAAFLNKFNYSIFDYENKQIQFYTDKYIIQNIKDNLYIMFLFCFNIIVCICNSILLLITIFINRSIFLFIILLLLLK